MLLARLFRRLARVGRLTVIDARGTARDFGPPDGEPSVTIRLHDKALHYKLFFNPDLYIGEAYMDGTLTIEEGTLDEFLQICCVNLASAEPTQVKRAMDRLRPLVQAITQHNPVSLARRHAAHHYDLSDSLYDLFLDGDRQYSCAYFESPNHTLEQAQDAKKRHLAAKLLLEPGCKVLDIGSGWGGFALYLTRVADADVTGVTLSEKQHRRSRERAAEAGSSDRVRFHLRDYREQPGTFDRIVSVGMFEHVGAKYYSEFFNKLRDLLADDGVAVLHSIGRTDGPDATNPWMRKYIFPGGYAPALSEVLLAIERSGLIVTDVEILRLHYAETLKEWSRRFSENRDTVAELYDERFCRMWEFYLAGCEMSFRYWNQIVFQIQLAKQIDTVPLTRDYIYEWERAHAGGAPLAPTEIPVSSPHRAVGIG